MFDIDIKAVFWEHASVNCGFSNFRLCLWPVKSGWRGWTCCRLLPAPVASEIESFTPAALLFSPVEDGWLLSFILATAAGIAGGVLATNVLHWLRPYLPRLLFSLAIVHLHIAAFLAYGGGVVAQTAPESAIVAPLYGLSLFLAAVSVHAVILYAGGSDRWLVRCTSALIAIPILGAIHTAIYLLCGAPQESVRLLGFVASLVPLYVGQDGSYLNFLLPTGKSRKFLEDWLSVTGELLRGKARIYGFLRLFGAALLVVAGLAVVNYGVGAPVVSRLLAILVDAATSLDPALGAFLTTPAVTKYHYLAYGLMGLISVGSVIHRILLSKRQ